MSRVRVHRSDLAESLLGVERTGAAGYEPFVRVERARLAELRGDEVGRVREISAAERLFRQMGADGHVERMRGAPGRAAAS